MYTYDEPRGTGLHEISQRNIAGVGRVFSLGSIWETPGTRKALARESMCKSTEVEEEDEEEDEEEEDGVKITDWTALECCPVVFSQGGKPRSWYIVATCLSHIQEASMACASICLNSVHPSISRVIACQTFPNHPSPMPRCQHCSDACREGTDSRVEVSYRA
jgi:hypothetical protein